MADKRMLSRKITDHDNFTTLPATAQALYLHLVLDADDDGFCDRTNVAISKAHAKKKDLEALVQRRYLIRFDSGVYAIKHWNMMNNIRADRRTPTEYQDDFRQLTVKQNGAYAMPGGCCDDARKADDCRADDSQMSAERPTDDGQAAANRGQMSGPDLGLGLGLVLNNTATAVKGACARTCACAREGETTALSRVMTFFFDKINPTPSQTAIDLLKDYTAALGADVVLHALGIALDERKTNWRYIQGILQGYTRNGLTTLDAVLRAEQEYAERRGGNGRAGNSASGQGAGEEFHIHYDVIG